MLRHRVVQTRWKQVARTSPPAPLIALVTGSFLSMASKREDHERISDRNSTRSQSIQDACSVTDCSLLMSSSSATTSNLTGAGRVLGNFISFSGRVIEQKIGNLAHNAGYGPLATAERLAAQLDALGAYRSLCSPPRWTVPDFSDSQIRNLDDFRISSSHFSSETWNSFRLTRDETKKLCSRMRRFML